MSEGMNTLEMLRQGARGEFVPPEPGQMAAETPAAPPSTTFSVLQMLKQGMRGEFKPETKEAKPSGGLIRNLAAGANEAIFSALGAPVDVGAAALRGLGLPIGEEPVGGSGWMQSQFGKVSVDPRTVQSDGLGDHIARSTGGGLAGLPLSAMAGAGVAATAGLGPVARAVGGAVANQPVAGSIAPIIGGAAVGSSLSSAAPDWAAPTVDVLGNMAGGGISAGLEHGIRVGGRKTITAPLGYAGVGPKQTVQGEGGEPLHVTRTQMDAARGQLTEAAAQSGPDGVQRFTDALQNNPEMQVPGSWPTTAQVAPLPGVAKLENTVRARPEGGPAFMMRDEAQNAARVRLIQSSPATGWRSGAVGDAFREMHDALDAEATQAGMQARGEVAGAVDALGSPKAPDAVGQGVRGAIEPVRTAEKTRIGRLYDAIDPDGTLALPVVDGRKTAASVMDGISPDLQRLMPGEERTILTSVAALPDVVPFAQVREYMTALGDVQRGLAGSLGWESQPVRRLTQVKRALENDIGQAAERVAANHEQAVAAGAMAPEQSIMGQINSLVGENAAPLGTATGGSGGVLRPTEAAMGAPGIREQGGAIGAGEGQPGGVAGGGAVASEAATGPAGLAPNFPPQAASQLRSANRQYRDYKEIYRQGDVGAILKSGRGGAEFSMSDTAAGQRIVAPEALRAYLAASKGAPEAMVAVQDALIADMRSRGAVLPDGTVNASKLKGWQDSRRHSLDQVPEISDKFRTVEAAQLALDDTMAVHSARLKEFQDGVARRFLNDEPGDAVSRILRSPDRVKGMRDTLAAVGDNADARASLQGHVVDFIIDRLTSTAKATEANAASPGIAEVGNFRPDTFRKWVSENKPWLRDLFSGGQGMQNIEMVASDLQRQQLRTQATAGSATAERLAGDKLGVARNYAPTVMALVGEQLASLAAEGMGAHGAARMGAAAAGAAIPLLAHALHQRGVTTVNALVREAMLHPDIARMLMQRPKDGQVGPVLQRRLAASLLAGSQTRGSEEVKQ